MKHWSMKDLQTAFPWLKALFHTQYCGMLKIDLHVCSSKTLTHKPILGIDFQQNLDSFACTSCRRIPCQKLCLYFVSTCYFQPHACTTLRICSAKMCRGRICLKQRDINVQNFPFLVYLNLRNSSLWDQKRALKSRVHSKASKRC